MDSACIKNNIDSAHHGYAPLVQSYKGTGVVVDGKFITSGACPVVSAKPGTVELVTQFIKILKPAQ